MTQLGYVPLKGFKSGFMVEDHLNHSAPKERGSVPRGSFTMTVGTKLHKALETTHMESKRALAIEKSL